MGCQYKRAYDNREVKLVIASESARAVLFKFCTNNLEAYKSPAGKNSYRQDFYIWPGYRDSLSFEDEMLKMNIENLFFSTWILKTLTICLPLSILYMFLFEIYMFVL